MRSKYLKSMTVFECHKAKDSSFVWQGIMKARQFLKKGCCYKIGNGLGINPWKDPWVHTFDNRIPSLKESVDTRRWNRVVDLRKENGQGWNEDLIQEICNEELAEAILKLSWPAFSRKDNLFWCGNTSGRFSVSNCFDLNCLEEGPVDGIWKSLWKSNVHEQLKIFGWRLLANALPTRDILARRIGIIDTCCLICGNNYESTFHLFKECVGIRAIAFASR